MRTINWQRAKVFYLSDLQRTYKDVAIEFKISYISVRIKGSKEKWRNQRALVIREMDRHIVQSVIKSATRSLEKTAENFLCNNI